MDDQQFIEWYYHRGLNKRKPEIKGSAIQGRSLLEPSNTQDHREQEEGSRESEQHKELSLEALGRSRL